MTHTPSPDTPRTRRGFFEQIAIVLEMIKFSHSIFALPFAFASMLVAADGWPSGPTIFWIVAASISARSAAMAYNRLVDRDIDAQNPRTRNRALPAGLISARFTKLFVAFWTAAFVASAAQLNMLCLQLSPLALAILFAYSHCKRFTQAAHYVLGVALAIAPVGAWIAVTGSLDARPLILALGVVCWVAGFDIIYACLDIESDRREGLHSIPARFGARRALQLSRVAHVVCAFFFAAFLWRSALGAPAWAALGVCAILLTAEHLLVRPDDLSRVGPAFFTFNAIISVLFFLGCAVSITF